MSKYYIIIAHDGTEVIDTTLEAEERIATMDYMEKDIKGNANIRRIRNIDS